MCVSPSGINLKLSLCEDNSFCLVSAAVAAATATSVSSGGVNPYDILSHHTLSELLQPKQNQFFVDEKGECEIRRGSYFMFNKSD